MHRFVEPGEMPGCMLFRIVLLVHATHDSAPCACYSG